MAPVQVADETWETLREEGAIIEEALEDDGYHPRPLKAIEETLEDDGHHSSLREKADEQVTSPSDAVVSTSFNEKSDRLHGYQMDVVDIHHDEHPPGNEDGQGSL